MTATHASDSTTATARVLYLALELGLEHLEAGLHHRPRPEAPAPHHRRPRHRRRCWPRSAPPRSGSACPRTPGRLLLRGRPRRLLAPSLPADPGRREHRRRLGQHRGQPPQAPGQVRPPRRRSSWWRCSSAGTTARRRSGRWSTSPSAEDEDRRQLHRELIALKAERTGARQRDQGAAGRAGPESSRSTRELPRRLERLRQWDGKPIPPGVRQRILREFERWQLVGRQIDDLEAQRRAKIRDDADAACREGAAAAGPQGDRGERGVAVGARSSSAGVRSGTAASWGAWRAWRRRRMPAARAGASKGSARRAIGGCGG